MLDAFYEILSSLTPDDVQEVGTVWSRTPCNSYFFLIFFFFTGREIYVPPLKGFYIVSILHEAAQYFIGIDLGKCL